MDRSGDLLPGDLDSVFDSGLRYQDAHETLNALAVHSQFDGHFATSEERAFQVQLIEPAEQMQVFRTLRSWLIVVCRSRHSQQFALLLDGQVRMYRIDPWTFINRGGQLFF